MGDDAHHTHAHLDAHLDAYADAHDDEGSQVEDDDHTDAYGDDAHHGVTHDDEGGQVGDDDHTGVVCGQGEGDGCHTQDESDLSRYFKNQRQSHISRQAGHVAK